MNRLVRRCRHDDRGAAAVEFALVVPVLLLLVFGIVEFGRAYNAQISLSAAAREGARTMAVENNTSRAREATVAAAPSLQPHLTTGQVTVSPASCSPGHNATVTVTYPLSFVGNLLGQGITLTGRAAMRCGG